MRLSQFAGGVEKKAILHMNSSLLPIADKATAPAKFRVL